MLAIDPHMRRTGYAWFERFQLRDWGTKNARSDTPSIRLKQQIIPLLIRMLDRYEPTVLVVPNVGKGGVRRSRYVQEAIRVATAEAVKRDIAVHSFTDKEVRAAFRDSQGEPAKSRAVINRLIVERYPELTVSHPRIRRTYDPEQYFTPLFHAVALYWTWRDLLSPDGDPCPPQSGDSSLTHPGE